MVYSTRIAVVMNSTSNKNPDWECTTPDLTDKEFKVWWDSQYDPAESHNIKGTNMENNIEIIEGTSLELNKIFYELERKAMEDGADFVGK